ncbi:MAG: hypothetical protein O7G28_10590 [Deltaproteobacteria bacterium]|nr:hypothetical protein [Deltaproteobacteria bacterium]
MATGEHVPEEEPKSETPSLPKPAISAAGEQASGEAIAASPTSGTEATKQFSGELPVTFQEVLEGLQERTRRGFPLFSLVLQPIVGALSHQVKKEFEIRVGNPVFFTTAMATGLNILLNLFAYPVLLVLFAVGLNGVDVLFIQKINSLVLLGFLWGLVEGVYRLKEGIFQARPPEDMIFRGSFYGVPLSGLVRSLMARSVRMVRGLPVPIEGFYGKGFVEKLERERRYGQAYTINDIGEAYHLRIEFPREVPDIGLPARSELPDEMPDYDYQLILKDGHFIIKGRCPDEKVRRLSGNVGAFPAEFTTVIPLQEKVGGFSHRCKDKILEVLLLKENSESLRKFK